MRIDSSDISLRTISTVRPVQESGAVQQGDDVSGDEAIEKVNGDKRTDAEKDDEVINDKMLDEAIKQANKTLETYDKYVERSVHKVTHTIIYTLKDSKTNQVIREFPPKKIQDMIAKMWELAGIFVDERR